MDADELETFELEKLMNEVVAWNPEKNTVSELKEICDRIGINSENMDMSMDRIGAFELFNIPLAKEYEQTIVSYIDETDCELFWAVDFEGNCLVGIPQKILPISELIKMGSK